MKMYLQALLIINSILLIISGCTQTVQLQAPDKPIAITVDVNIKQQLDKTISSNKQLF